MTGGALKSLREFASKRDAVVAAKLGEEEICGACGATLGNFHELCDSADGRCEGHSAIASEYNRYDRHQERHASKWWNFKRVRLGSS